MNSLVLVFCSLGIVFSIVMSIADLSKFEKELRLMFTAIVLITLIKSLSGVDLSILDGVSLDTNPYSVEEISTDDYATKEIVANLEESVGLLLEDNKITCENISVSINITDDSCISINSISLLTDDFERAEAVINNSFGNVTVINLSL